MVHVAGQPAAARRPQARGPGLHVGGYGCVERLRPETTPDSLGYVTGPSLAHAATAGVLRSGRLANPSIDRLDVDVSSARVARGAGADAGRARGRGRCRCCSATGSSGRCARTTWRCSSSPLRTEFPLRQPADDATQPVEATPPHDVVNAADLLDAWPRVFIDPVPPPFVFRVAQRVGLQINDPRVERMMVQFTALADTYDAVADVVLAEAVHQTLAANPERAQAATRFLDRQEAPAEPDVTATPRRSHAYVQRCAVAIGAPQLSAAWRALAANDPRVQGEPRVNAWVAAPARRPRRLGVQRAGRGRRRHGWSDRGRDAGGPRPLTAGVARGRRQRQAATDRRSWRSGSGGVLAARLDVAEGGGIELLADTAGALGLACVHVDVQCDRQGAADGAPGRRPDVRPAGQRRTERRRCGRAGAPRATRAEQRLRTVSQRLDAALAVSVPKTGRVRAALDQVSRAGVPGAVPPAALFAEPDGDAGLGGRRRPSRRRWPPPRTCASASSTPSAAATGRPPPDAA